MATSEHYSNRSSLETIQSAKTGINTDGIFVPSGAIVSNEVREVFETVFELWVCIILALLGMITNTLNCTVLFKQGFQESVNILFMALAIADLLMCTCGAVHRLYGIIRIFDYTWGRSWYALTWNVLQIQMYATNITSALASFVAVQRCLCVSLPFRVKMLTTRRMTLTSVLAISLVVIATMVPFFFASDIIWIWDAKFNTTVAVFVPSKLLAQNYEFFWIYSTVIFNFWPILSFCTILVSSVVIFRALHKSQQFRQTMHVKEKNILSRDKRLEKMLGVIVSIHFIDLIPKVVLYLTRILEEEFFTRRHYHNLHAVFMTIMYIFNFINSSTNFFIYLSMNSKFRSKFLEMFCLCTQDVSKDNSAT